jgi:hypothetical protein
MEAIEEEEPVEISLMNELDYEDSVKFMLELCELAGSKFNEARWENAFSKRVSSPDKYCGFITRRGKKPLGMLFAEIRGEIGQITNLYVVPEERHTEIVGPMRVPKKGLPVAERMVETAFNFLRAWLQRSFDKHEKGCKTRRNNIQQTRIRRKICRSIQKIMKSSGNYKKALKSTFSLSISCKSLSKF